MADPANERLIVFAKAPVAGRVKTRLAKTHGDDLAVRLYTAFVHDVTRRLRPVRTILYHDPQDPGPVLAALGFPMRPQEGTDLGARIEAAFAAEQRAGFERVVIIGCDSPDLPSDRIAGAFAALRGADLVLGPAFDGGFYLIGARGVPPVFGRIGWGGPSVLAETVANARAAGLRVASLEPWYDVDDEASLGFLRAHLELLEAAGEGDRCPATSLALSSLGGHR